MSELNKISFENYINNKLFIEKELKHIFKHNKPVIFEIGACEGEDTIRYHMLFPESTIYAFEPLPENFKLAFDNIYKYANKKVNLYNFAVCDKVGFSNFFVSSGNPEVNIEDVDFKWNFGNKSSSLYSPNLTLKEFDWLKFNERIQVETVTLNSFCEVNGIESVDFIHIDVQGAELDVLKGSSKILSRIKVIWLEVEKVELYKNQPLAKDIEIFLSENGFVKVIDTCYPKWGDQLYVNSKLFKIDFFLKWIILKDRLKKIYYYFKNK